jgi:hypothetical protein
MTDQTVEFIRESCKNGQRKFVNIDIEDGDLSNENLDGLFLSIAFWR